MWPTASEHEVQYKVIFQGFLHYILTVLYNLSLDLLIIFDLTPFLRIKTCLNILKLIKITLTSFCVLNQKRKEREKAKPDKGIDI